ncbi:MAG: HEAT repeat domain-containing protein [Desulfobacteria bacterium]
MTEETDHRGHFRDRSEERVQGLVDRLNSLKDGDLAVAELAACGKRVVEPLRRFLLYGKPSGIYQPRQLAVEALAELGAKDVLLEYLASEKHISDPVDRYGEEAVENTAARLLAGWRDEEVYNVLLRLLRRKPMPGVIETIGEYRRIEAIPDFIRALGDDVAGGSAEEALRKIGESAHRALLDAALTWVPSAADESPSSLRRRAAALRLLADRALSAEDWGDLSALTCDRDPEIAARACRIALLVAEERCKRLAVRRLVEVVPEADLFLQTEMENWLVRRFGSARIVIDEEIARRQHATEAVRSPDKVLRFLLAVKRRAEGESREGHDSE